MMNKSLLEDLKKALVEFEYARSNHSSSHKAYRNAIEDLEFYQHKVNYLKSAIERDRV